MAKVRPLVNDAGSPRESKSTDYLDTGKLSVSNQETITVTGTTITVSDEVGRVYLDASSAQDVQTINGCANGDWLVIQGLFGTSNVTVKDGVGNVHMKADVVLNQVEDTLILSKLGANWFEVNWSPG